MQVGMQPKRVVNDFEGARLDERVGWDDDATHAVILDERVNDRGQVTPEHRFPARKPEVCDLRHGARDLLDLLERHVAGTIQLRMIKAGLAKSITTRGDKQDHRAETLIALRRTQELNKLDGFISQANTSAEKISLRLTPYTSRLCVKRCSFSQRREERLEAQRVE